MKTINKHTLSIILIALTLHLWYSNSELLIAAKELASEKAISLFDTVALIIFALSYSLITAISVLRLKHWIAILVFSFIDGFAIYLRINVDHNHYIITSAIFYGFYTGYIIIISYLLKSQNETEAKTSNSVLKKSDQQSEIINLEKPNEKRRLQNKLNATKNEAKRAAIETEIKKLEIEKSA